MHLKLSSEKCWQFCFGINAIENIVDIETQADLRPLESIDSLPSRENCRPNAYISYIPTFISGISVRLISKVVKAINLIQLQRRKE